MEHADSHLSSPGYVLENKFLIPKKWSLAQLASLLQMPVQEVQAIINDELPITEMRACHLAEGFGTTEEYWLQLEEARTLPASRKLLQSA